MTIGSVPAAAQTFNDDLLASVGDREKKSDLEKARELYPTIIHVLDHPELRESFKAYDEPANAAKRRGHRAGYLTILFGALSLAALAVEPALAHREGLKELVVVASAILAVLGLIGARGLLFAKAKSEWLHRRLMTERLRQFHFQTFVRRFADIVASLKSPSAVDHYLEQRRHWFSQFQRRHEGKLPAELGDILDSDDEEDFWLHQPSSAIPTAGAGEAVPEIFAAYRQLRIIHQLQYATYKLGESDSLIPASPRSQAECFSSISMVCIAAVLLIHVVIGIGVFLWDSKVSVWLSIVALWFAIGALAVRALEEGLKPDRELERYQKYRVAIKAVRDRFDEAVAAEKLEVMKVLEIMKDMERLVFDEMRDFLHTHARARFVM